MFHQRNMRLPFVNRQAELSRLKKLWQGQEGRLAVLYGRRRCGKSRLLLESLPAQRVYYLADERSSALQRAALAAEMAALVPGFDRVTYSDWDSLFGRWWNDAPAGSVLAIDEFPALVHQANEIPSVLQRYVDRPGQACHLVLCGSSQRLMHGLVLDRQAALFGRAREILMIKPLHAGWLSEAVEIEDGVAAIEAYSVWGGIPRYWELFAEYSDLASAFRALILDPLGVLHDEPTALLQDDLRDSVQAASILQLIGQGCHRLSELAGRLEIPATSLGRPLSKLCELNLVTRERPYGALEKDSKRSYYQISDPFLRFWFRFVGPQRSRLTAGLLQRVSEGVTAEFSQHVAQVWEELARASVPHSDLGGIEWNPAHRWWGPGLDRKPLEIDVVADSLDGKSVLLGSVKWEEKMDTARVWSELELAARRFPLTNGRQVKLALWTKHMQEGPSFLDPSAVLKLLRY